MTTNKKIIFIVASFSIIAIIFALTYHGKSGTTSSTSSTTFPVSGTGTNTNQNQTALPIIFKDGSSATVPDFTKENQPSYANATDGFVAAGGEESDFTITYFPDGSYFDIILNVEPLGETRKKAEAALRARLNLTDEQLCKLNTQVVTTSQVNQQYSGSNLGLSFCPGAVTLP
ncbi:MAG: hypothetical protein JWL75_587 [Parcubacteria group bacterium]|nr:hypothetical protein [Parcubacteria group bacterium]